MSDTEFEMQEDKNHPEYQKYLQDLQKYPLNEYYFEFGKIRFKINRNYFGCWNGYLLLPTDGPDSHPDLKIDSSLLDDIYQFYGGMTAYLGFDTSHLKDFKPIYPYNEPDATYKDYSFMYKEFQRLSKIANERLIDHLETTSTETKKKN